MNILLQNLTNLEKVKNVLTSRQEVYSVQDANYDKYPINSETISILMTSHNRSKQVYFTLDTISLSKYHNNVQLILIDDSNTDKVAFAELSNYPFAITFVEINRPNKCWTNPCVNYNIGFQFIKGTKVIIQNSEVCHAGDVLATLSKIQDNHYYAYDVKAFKNFESNDYVYSHHNIYKNKTHTPLTTEIYTQQQHLFSQWYQHIAKRNAFYHFLVACTKTTLDKIGQFSLDYSFGTAYDDDDFVLKIKLAGITLVNMCHYHHGCGGIHLYHSYTPENISPELNLTLFQKKQRYSQQNNNKYLEISDANTIEEKLNKYNELNKY